MAGRAYPTLTLLLLVISVAGAFAQQGRTPQKHALLIAIDDYPAGSGYDTIHASNDIPLVRAGLLSQGFAPDQMQLLMNASATRQGIRMAIEQLGRRAQKGDVLVVFYAGHGCQITDDNGDEADGYDEALVPFDAVDTVATDPSQSRHLRDDELNRMVAGLRESVGPTGNVVLLFDACNSGSITRGGAEAPIRGRRAPLGPPAAPGRRQESQGTIADVAGTTSSTRGGGQVRAPYVVISACQHYQSDHEIAIENDRGEIIHVGPLAWALGRALPAARPGATYRSLFEKIKTLMASQTLMQEPQMEGDADVELFSGSVVEQGHYFRIARRSGGNVVLRGGSLVGLLAGTTVAFHPVGTIDPAGSTALAEGTVTSSDHLESTVDLDRALPESDGSEPWAFVTGYAFEQMRLRVMLDRSLDGKTAAALQQSLTQSRFVDIVREAPEVLVRRARGGSQAIELLTTENDTLPAPSDPEAADAGKQIIETLRGYARAKYLRRLEMSDNTIRVEVEVVPVFLKTLANGECGGVEKIDSTRKPSAGGQWVFRAGEPYMLRIRNSGSARAWITVLAISSNGEIAHMYPDEEHARDNRIGPGGIFQTLRNCYRAAAPFGTDVIKVFATRERLNFAPVIASRGAASRSGTTHPLEELVAGTYSSTRGVTVERERGGGAATAAATIIVIP